MDGHRQHPGNNDDHGLQAFLGTEDQEQHQKAGGDQAEQGQDIGEFLEIPPAGRGHGLSNALGFVWLDGRIDGAHER